MCFKSGLELKDSIIKYLKDLQRYELEDIQTILNLSREDKIQNGFLIPDAVISNKNEFDQYELQVKENNSKLRPGDSVILYKKETEIKVKAKIIENNFNVISINATSQLEINEIFDIEVIQSSVLDTIISVAAKLEPGAPGFSFLKQLTGEDVIRLKGFSELTTNNDYSFLNSEQLSITKLMFQRPSMRCLQGPPGTGKTKVLSAIAQAFSKEGKEVLIISLTHQAVNNALNAIHKISENNKNIQKIGDKIKAEGLNSEINNFQYYGEYISYRKKNKKNKNGAIVGMTFHSAMSNLGLHSSGFTPSIIMVDEAGQMPMYFGTLIGILGAGSILFLGDDRQMPPIFHPKLENNSLSTSIFSWICEKFPELKTVLTTTYRMNDEITEYVSKNFYEPYGIKLKSHKSSAKRQLLFNCENEKQEIKDIFETEKSIHELAVSSENWEDFNKEEANFILIIVRFLIKQNFNISDFAIVTPFRRQVKTIRATLLENGIEEKQMPLIDTVERLQGQDVEMIIISFAVTDQKYFLQNEAFIMNKNRLNVMVSRAKRKVIILKGKKINKTI